MSTITLLVTLLPVAVIAWFLYRKHRDKTGPRRFLTLAVPGLGTVIYHADKIGNPKGIAADLLATLDVTWTEYERIYGRVLRYHLSTIHIDPSFHKVAELQLGPRKLTLNPTMDYRKGFAAELHNLYRATLHGPQHVYCDEAINDDDRRRCREAERVWQGME